MRCSSVAKTSTILPGCCSASSARTVASFFSRTAKPAGRWSPEGMAWRRSVMARTAPRPPPDREQVLETVHRACPACGGRLRYRYDNRHTVTTLDGLVRLHLRIRRCEDPACVRHHRPYRPEAEGAIVLPQHEFG